MPRPRASSRQSRLDHQSTRSHTGHDRHAFDGHALGATTLRNLDGNGKVSALISLGGANHGTQTAQLCFQVSCQQMWPNSSFLTALNATDETWGTPRYATWYSPCDEVIKPYTSTILDGAVANTQTACMQHSQLHEDATVYGQVRDLILSARRGGHRRAQIGNREVAARSARGDGEP